LGVRFSGSLIRVMALELCCESLPFRAIDERADSADASINRNAQFKTPDSVPSRINYLKVTARFIGRI